MSALSRDEIRAVLKQRGFERDDFTRTHAESLTLPGGEMVKLKKFNAFPLVVDPRHEGAWNDLAKIRGVMPSPDRVSHNSNFVGFQKRVHAGRNPIAYGFDFGFESASALNQFLDVLTRAKVTEPAFDAEGRAFVEGFLDGDNPQFAYWLPRYQSTLANVSNALSRNAPDELFDLIWKSRDNSVSNAGQGVMGFDAADRLRGKLIDVIRDIAADGSAEAYDTIIDRFEQWRASGELASVPRLLVARAFAAIHPDRYHTTVDAAKHDRVLEWFEQHTGFATPEGNWAAKAAALTAHLDRNGVFEGDRERRNMFPWFVFDQLRDAKGRVPFRWGHVSRPATGEATGSAQPRTIAYRQNVIQDRLVQRLRALYGEKSVATEHATGTGGRADALVERADGTRELFEIKPAATARDAVRQALGQLLEYSYRRGGLDPSALHVVSDAPIDDLTDEYLKQLEARFGLKLSYWHIESGEHVEAG